MIAISRCARPRPMTARLAWPVDGSRRRAPSAAQCVPLSRHRWPHGRPPGRPFGFLTRSAGKPCLAEISCVSSSSQWLSRLSRSSAAVVATAYRFATRAADSRSRTRCSRSTVRASTSRRPASGGITQSALGARAHITSIIATSSAPVTSEISRNAEFGFTAERRLNPTEQSSVRGYRPPGRPSVQL